MEPELLVNSLRRQRGSSAEYCLADATALRARLESAPFDVVLLSENNGYATVLGRFQDIRRDHRHVRLILMVESCDRKMAMDAFEAGARGIFRVGEQSFKMLCKCISTVHGGQVWASAGQLECLLQVVSQTSSLRIPAHRLPGSTSQHLTDREGEVVRLVAEGLSNREISAELKISEHTVKRHLVRIFENLGVTNRVELVLSALSQGTEEPSSEPVAR
jgi:DNA-binding NarL/FixJ family response regulator